MGADQLSVAARAGSIQALRESLEPGKAFDILVVGGGITGAGIALDAASRGLKVAVVEAQDWASGTSSRSSKLLHGGLRYLEMFDFSLVHEALLERNLLTRRLAPHLVRAVPFIYPLRNNLVQRPYVGTGIMLYDLLSRWSLSRLSFPSHRHLGRGGLAKAFPGLRPSTAIGGVQYWDAQVDDARLVLSVLRTATHYGAHAVSRCRLEDLTKVAGVVQGCDLTDLESGEKISVRARTVINATGVWTDEVQDLVDCDGAVHVVASKGIHLVFPRSAMEGSRGLILQTPLSVLFVIPWQRYWLVGTTDTPYEGALDDPDVSDADIDYLLGQLNSHLSRPLSRSDIIGAYAGLRPLVRPRKSAATTRVSREHVITESAPGLITIVGGKLTSYRLMAKDAIDFALRKSSRRRPSLTDRIPLIGASPLIGSSSLSGSSPLPGATTDTRIDWRYLSGTYGWAPERSRHLLQRYGSLITDLLDLIAATPDLVRPLRSAPAYIRAEIAYACTHEGALHLEDILARRTRIVFEQADSGAGALDEIAEIAASLLDWSSERVDQEVRSYLEGI